MIQSCEDLAELLRAAVLVGSGHESLPGTVNLVGVGGPPDATFSVTTAEGKQFEVRVHQWPAGNPLSTA